MPGKILKSFIDKYVPPCDITEDVLELASEIAEEPGKPGLKSRVMFHKNYIQPALAAGLIP